MEPRDFNAVDLGVVQLFCGLCGHVLLDSWMLRIEWIDVAWRIGPVIRQSALYLTSLTFTNLRC